MIQRIQTIFLLLAGAAFGALFALPFATSDKTSPDLLSDRTFDVMDNPILMILAGVGVLVSLISIFMFKNRKTQIKLGYIMIILGILIPIAAYLLFTNEAPNIPEEANISDGIGAYIPFAAIILALLANRFIKKDDKLVKSMDRLR